MIEQVMSGPKARFRLSGDHLLLAEYLLTEDLEWSLKQASQPDTSIVFSPKELALLTDVLCRHKALVAAKIVAMQQPPDPVAPA